MTFLSMLAPIAEDLQRVDALIRARLASDVAMKVTVDAVYLPTGSPVSRISIASHSRRSSVSRWRLGRD